MIDLKWVREQPQAFDRALARRGLPPASATILELDAARRELETGLQEAQATRNRLSREIGQAASSRGAPPLGLLEAMTELKERVKSDEENLRVRSKKLNDRLLEFPNVIADDVPDGVDESQNVVLRRWGDVRSFTFEPRSHDTLGPALGMDFEGGVKISGTRFVVLRGQLALLERALCQLMLELQTGPQHGYTEISVPLLVHNNTARGTGQLPKFAEDLFRVEKRFEDHDASADYYLIPTAEVPLTYLVAGGIVDEAKLPFRWTACTPCFRAEAGAAGRDTKGMIRQHQFMKVELVSITSAEQSEAEHERMTACAEEVLKLLGLPYRVVLLCAGDTGFNARKTYDIEVWLPGQDRFREISSCSNCGDFQARRMKARSRIAGEKQTRFVHTLNGSGLAVGRSLIAVLENYQEADGSVVVPEALRPFMNGRDRLVPEGR